MMSIDRQVKLFTVENLDVIDGRPGTLVLIDLELEVINPATEINNLCDVSYNACE